MHTSDRIYVAGHTGLLGSALVRRLRAMGYSNLLLATHRDLDLTSMQRPYKNSLGGNALNTYSWRPPGSEALSPIAVFRRTSFSTISVSRPTLFMKLIGVV